MADAKLPQLKHDKNVPPPVSAQAAFAHPIRAKAAEYIRATVYLLC